MQRALEKQLRDVFGQFGPALWRVARIYERDASLQPDLVQEMWIALARALPGFEERCSLRTFVFRVAHNVGTSHALRESRRNKQRWQDIEDLPIEPASQASSADTQLGHQETLAQVQALLDTIKPIDRQVAGLMFEGCSALEVSEVTGLSVTNVTTKFSRIRAVLRARLEVRS